MNIALPKGFPIPTNAGHHGDMQFFEMGSIQFTVEGPVFEGDRVSFCYRGHDSNEGSVTVSYQSINGLNADDPEAEGFDVEITTGSDVWGLKQTSEAIADAIALHIALRPQLS